jgi:hypothetical protein
MITFGVLENHGSVFGFAYIFGYRFIAEGYCDAQGLSVPASRYVTR